MKKRIISRISSLEAKKKSSVEGVRILNLDISNISKQGLVYDKIKLIWLDASIQDTFQIETIQKTYESFGSHKLEQFDTQIEEENIAANKEAKNFETKRRQQNFEDCVSDESRKNIYSLYTPNKNLETHQNITEQTLQINKQGTEKRTHIEGYKHHEFHSKEKVHNEKLVDEKISQVQESHLEEISFEFVVANYDYIAQKVYKFFYFIKTDKENDLSFIKGDRVQVLRKTETGWWIGLCHNKIGYFPCNYVGKIWLNFSFDWK